MTTPGNNTLDRIQKEIKETLQREDELRNKYEKLYNNNEKIIDNNISVVQQAEKPSITSSSNGIITNGNGTSNGNANITPSTHKPNSFKRFTPNTTTRGVMHKFLKLHGKVSAPGFKDNKPTNNWNYEDAFEPAKVTIEKGKPPRNGFISAEEKMKRELLEIQTREAELRKERRKSQPDLMATLELDHDLDETSSITNLKFTKSMANLSMNDDVEFSEANHSSAPCSLKPGRSLAALCDVSDEELDTPGTYSLIMQFEKMKNHQVRS